jgi:quercetin dioxygenase-like cupin family protein
MDRRTFTALMPALMAAAALPSQEPGMLQPGTHEPGTEYNLVPGSTSAGLSGHKGTSHSYLLGMLRAGNFQLQMHETTQEVGALHEPKDRPLHNEIWCVKHGTCELAVNGVVRAMREGDVGLVSAGDKHWVRNAGDVPCTYFVITIGAPGQFA